MELKTLAKLYNELATRPHYYSEREELLYLRKKISRAKKILNDEIKKNQHEWINKLERSK